VQILFVEATTLEIGHIRPAKLPNRPVLHVPHKMCKQTDLATLYCMYDTNPRNSARWTVNAAKMKCRGLPTSVPHPVPQLDANQPAALFT
jgi:hypothetical protein